MKNLFDQNQNIKEIAYDDLEKITKPPKKKPKEMNSKPKIAKETNSTPKIVKKDEDLYFLGDKEDYELMESIKAIEKSIEDEPDDTTTKPKPLMESAKVGEIFEFTCAFCGEKFTDMRIFLDHATCKHLNKKSTKCTINRSPRTQ